MRIVGGELRGFPIHFPDDRRIRPTQDKLRQAVFNVLGPLQNITFLDLFSGTGAVGFEAFSRGAHRVVLVDQVTKWIQKNHEGIRQRLVQASRDQEFANAVHIMTGDAHQILPEVGTMDIIYLDPPWTHLPYFDTMLRMIHEYGILSPNGRVVIEHPPTITINPWGLVPFFGRVYGNTAITMVKP